MGTLSARILVTFCQNVGCFLLEYKTLAARIYVFFHIRSIIYTMWLVHIQKNVFANWCHEKRVAVYCVMLQGVDVCCRVLQRGTWVRELMTRSQKHGQCFRLASPCTSESWGHCLVAACNMSSRNQVSTSCSNSSHELMVRVFVWSRRAHPSHVAAFWRFCVLALIVPPEYVVNESCDA